MSIEAKGAKDIFNVAIEEYSPDDWPAYLDDACSGNEKLRCRVEELLNAHQGRDAFLDAGDTVDQPPRDQPGEMIDHYRLMEQIGEGGMGVVYVAEQQKPIRRRVALKVIKPGMDSKEVVSRFAAERQALALMDHPNIAKVHDAGTTGSGRPYFVMELVRGIAITEYCNLNRFSAQERLGLFVNVCQAVQHAHQKGVIHRDLKPTNVLVTEHDGKPVVKVIDFGVAKAINQNLTERTIYTRHQQMVGTPMYMSPEQAALSGLDVDTRSDIYSLGVLLYELLTGTTPFDKQRIQQAAFDEIRRIIREEEPSKPSTKVRTLESTSEEVLSGYRREEKQKLSQLLRGDMDWIVMKALEKERNRRYDTAKGLANDIERHLNNQPISARPPSASYQMQKFVRRHRMWLTSAALVALALIFGSGAAVWMALEANRAKLEAETNLARAKEAETQQREVAEEANRLARLEAEARADTQDALDAVAAQEAVTRQQAYVSDVRLAQFALEQSNIRRARRLLSTYVPSDGKPDLRGWEWRYLWQHCRSRADACLRPADNSPNWALQVSQNGRWLAHIHQTGPRQLTLTIDNLATGKRIEQLTTQRHVLSVCPLEPLLAMVPDQKPTQVEVRNLEDQKQIALLSLNAPIWHAEFSGSGEYLVIAAGAQISRWDTSDWSVVDQAPGPGPGGEGDPFAVSFSGDLTAFTRNGELWVYSWSVGDTLWTKPITDSRLTAVAFSEDERMLASATGYAATGIHLWDAPSGNELAHLEGHRGWVSGLRFWPDGSQLVSSSADQTVRVWEIDQLDRPKCTAQLMGHTSEVWGVEVLPERGQIYSAGKDGEIYRWRLSGIDEVDFPKSIDRSVSNWAFTDDGRKITTVNQKGDVEQWAMPDFHLIRHCLTIPTLRPFRIVGRGSLGAPCFSEDGQLIAANANGVVTVWDIERGKSLCELPRSRETASAMVVGFAGKDHLLLRYPNRSLRLWNLGTLQEEPFPGDKRVSRGVWATSPDFNLQVTLDYLDAAGQITNLETGSVQACEFDVTRVVDVAISSNNRLIATACQSTGTVALWSLETQKLLGRFQEHLTGVHSVAFTPDEERLASGSGGADAIKIWDVKTKRELLNLEADGVLLGKTGFSPDGNTVATLAGDGRLYIWHAPSWSDISELDAEQ